MARSRPWASPARGVAVVLTTALTAACSAWYICSRRAAWCARGWRGCAWPCSATSCGVGVVGSVSTLQTTLTVALTTALVGAAAGPDAVAGYGTGSRLEYLLIPLVFGLGAPLVALVGTNIGAGQRQRALRVGAAGRRGRLLPGRGRRPRGGDLADGLARPVRQRPAHAGDRRRLSAHGRADLRLLRPRPVRSISPPRAPAGCFGRCWQGWCGWCSRSAAAGWPCA